MTQDEYYFNEAAKDGSGKLMGGSADAPADAKLRDHKPVPDYTGFRVIMQK